MSIEIVDKLLEKFSLVSFKCLIPYDNCHNILYTTINGIDVRIIMEQQKASRSYSLWVNGQDITNTLTFWQKHRIKKLFKSLFPKLKKEYHELNKSKTLDGYSKIIEDMLYLEE